MSAQFFFVSNKGSVTHDFFSTNYFYVFSKPEWKIYSKINLLLFSKYSVN